MLKDAVHEERYRADYDGFGNPYQGMTHCNQFCAEVLGWYAPSFPWGRFADPKFGACKMVGEMQRNTGEWTQCVNWDTAHAHAARGHLVIAGRVESEGNGHVCVIAPEKMEYSGSWMKRVPLCANVGRSVFYGLRLSRAFKTEPEAWLFLGNKEET